MADNPDAPPREYSDNQLLATWPATREALRGLANHMARAHNDHTASQLRMALQLAQDAYERLATPAPPTAQEAPDALGPG